MDPPLSAWMAVPGGVYGPAMLDLAHATTFLFFFFYVFLFFLFLDFQFELQI
jgi:hypothetical protein